MLAAPHLRAASRSSTSTGCPSSFFSVGTRFNTWGNKEWAGKRTWYIARLPL